MLDAAMNVTLPSLVALVCLLVGAGASCTPKSPASSSHTNGPLALASTEPRAAADTGGVTEPLAIAGDPDSEQTRRAPPDHATTQHSVRRPFFDPEPPMGWRQCAGFINTVHDDVDASFLDACLGGNRLRVRVFDADGRLEDDVFLVGYERLTAWPAGGYLEGESTIVTQTHWGGLDGGAQSVFFTHSEGRDACFQGVAPHGTTLGSGHAERAIIAGDASGYDEYRLSCGKEPLPDRMIAIYN